MAFTVVYDTCALFGATSRDLLIRIARARLVQAKWSEAILEELKEKLIDKRAYTVEKFARLRTLMCDAVPDCLVEGYEPLIEGLKLADADDRHVLAVAIQAGAQVIVTDDRGFRPEYLSQYGIEAKTPDDFVADLIGLAHPVVRGCVQGIVDQCNNPPVTFEEVLTKLERAGLIASATQLRYGYENETPDP
ncbi:MAG: PIN domain-containing protein [Steroidobacteraceae bacterium]